MVALFGNQSGTPAITTLQVNPGDGNGIRQVGVAILPGGIDGPPVKGGSASAPSTAAAATARSTSTSATHLPAPHVRSPVGRPCANTDPVAGRGVTIVRLDTGEIIRHFGRSRRTSRSGSSARRPTPRSTRQSSAPPSCTPTSSVRRRRRPSSATRTVRVWRLDLSSRTRRSGAPRSSRTSSTRA